VISRPDGTCPSFVILAGWLVWATGDLLGYPLQVMLACDMLAAQGGVL